jgi:diacylglycerol kinase family enzyme
MDATQALNSLFTSRIVPMDTFRLNGRLSLNVSGIGFDGYVAELFGLEKQRGFQGYTKLVLNEFMNFQEFEAEIIADGRTVVKNAFVIAIANSSQYGNNAKIAPGASVCDGLLNISVLKKFPPYRLDFIYSFFSGTIEESGYCEILQVSEASIRLRSPMAYHIDGEPAGKADHFTIALIPASLNMLVPGEIKNL